MRSSVLLLVWLVVGLALPVHATDTRAPARVERGLLWKIESPGREPSYLFGTVHSSDTRILALLPKLHAFLSASRSFSMELIFNGRGFIAMGESMFFNDGRRLPAILGEALYTRTQKALAARGLPTAGLESKKPWAVMMLLSVKRQEGLLFLDLALMREFVAQDKPTYALETMEEQIAVFDQMSIEDQAALLAGTVDMSAAIEAQTEELVNIYLSGDLRRLMSFAQAQEAGPKAAYLRLMDRLLTQRNRRMAERMRMRIEEGGAFIAVGALHLPGPEGLLELLREQGYRVSAVW